VIGRLVMGLAVLWAVGIPAGQPVGSYVGQLLGAESVLLMSVAVVLISTCLGSKDGSTESTGLRSGTAGPR
jgi:hypothetical protein